MPGMLVDTSGWGNLVDSSQPYHSLASSLYRDARLRQDRIITNSYVIVELVALLTSPLRIPRSDIIAFIEGVKQSPFIEIVYVDQAIDEAAWQLLGNRQDKDWSLVDCVSFVIMATKHARSVNDRPSLRASRIGSLIEILAGTLRPDSLHTHAIEKI